MVALRADPLALMSNRPQCPADRRCDGRGETGCPGARTNRPQGPAGPWCTGAWSCGASRPRAARDRQGATGSDGAIDRKAAGPAGAAGALHDGALDRRTQPARKVRQDRGGNRICLELTRDRTTVRRDPIARMAPTARRDHGPAEPQPG